MAYEVGDEVEIRVVGRQTTEEEERTAWVRGVISSTRTQPEEAYRVETKCGVVGAGFTRERHDN